MENLDKRLMRVKIEDILYLIDLLDRFGLVLTDFDLLEERLHRLGFLLRKEYKKHGKIMEK